MPIVRLPFGEWKPDAGEYLHDGLWKVSGIMPYAGTWTAIPGITGEDLSGGTAPYTETEIYGFHLHPSQSTPNNVRIIVGTSDTLLRGVAYEDLTTQPAAGVAPSFATPPDTVSGIQFCSFGNSCFAAMRCTTVGNSAFWYASSLAAGSTTDFVALVPGGGIAPAGAYYLVPRFVSTIKNHLLISHCYSKAAVGPFALNTEYPNLVAWSKTGVATCFGDASTSTDFSGSGYQDLPDECGQITGMIGGDYALIFKPRAIYRMDGPPFTFHPISIGSGTMFPNSIVRYNDDVYYWGPAGLMVIRGGSSSPEPVGLGKTTRSVTEFQNYDFFDYVLEIDAFFGSKVSGMAGTTRGIDICGVADTKAGIVAMFAHDSGITNGAGAQARPTPCITYDVNSQTFGFFQVGNKFAFPKMHPRHGLLPMVPTGITSGHLSQHSVLDGCYGLYRSSATVGATMQAGVCFGDAKNTVSGTPDAYWSPSFTWPFQYFAQNDSGPMVSRIHRIRVPFSASRNGNLLKDLAGEGQLSITVTVISTDSIGGARTAKQGSLTYLGSSSIYTVSPDDWILIDGVQAMYHKITIDINMNDPDNNTLARWIAHIKDLKLIEVEVSTGGGVGSVAT